jgi:hypothetical protein
MHGIARTLAPTVVWRASRSIRLHAGVNPVTGSPGLCTAGGPQVELFQNCADVTVTTSPSQSEHGAPGFAQVHGPVLPTPRCLGPVTEQVVGRARLRPPLRLTLNPATFFDSLTACTAANCAACAAGSTTTCATCKSGFTLKNGQCSSQSE